MVEFDSIRKGFVKVSTQACSEMQVCERLDGRVSDISPSSLDALLQQCISRKSLLEGRIVHNLSAGIGYETNAHLGSYLIRMFIACGSLHEANSVFSKIYKPNVYAWSEILLANVRSGQSGHAIYLYHQMHLTHVKPDKCVYLAVLKACGKANALEEGRKVHEDIIRCGLERNVFLLSGLIDMYAKCKSLRDAWEVFRSMPTDDVVIWNTMVAGFCLHGHCAEALQLLYQMQHEGPQPDIRTWTAILAGYSFQGHNEDASRLFQQMSYEGLQPTIISWNALISGFVVQGESSKALEIYYQMMREGCMPDEVTAVSILKACANAGDLQHGRLIHGQMAHGESSISVQTSLIDMYSKCGSLEDAKHVFENIPVKDVASYNSLLLGYMVNGFSVDALCLFHRMQKEGVMLDYVTLLHVIKLCSSISALRSGKLVHGIAIEDGADKYEFVSSSLIDMYVQNGSLKDACNVFGKMSKDDICGWNALIAGYMLDDDIPSVYKTLEEMRLVGITPDGVTFVSLLNACSLIGAIGEGSDIFNYMRESYSISPIDEHFGCMIDLLGNAGCLIEAGDILNVMPMQPKIVPWTSLLNSSRMHNDVALAEHCFEHIMDIDECCSSAFSLMSDVYTTADMNEALGQLKAMKQQANAWKKPGKAYIEVDGIVHDFLVSDQLHTQSVLIYEKLALMCTQLKRRGFIWQF